MTCVSIAKVDVQRATVANYDASTFSPRLPKGARVETLGYDAGVGGQAEKNWGAPRQTEHGVLQGPGRPETVEQAQQREHFLYLKITAGDASFCYLRKTQ